MKSSWGDFDIDFSALLGRGGMGTVYRARQRSLDREVAVKILDVSKAPGEEFEQAFHDRFAIESKALASLCDPRIITILQAGQDEGKCWYAMELIEGETVDERLTKKGMFGEREGARIAGEVARALAAAHRQGIIHRDVKPANIFLLRDGGVKLGDFGLARSPKFHSTRLTEMNAVAATPTYCSPEQGMGGDCDHRSDIYSLGVVLFEMLTERPPFAGENGMETLFQHMNDEPPSLRTLNPSLTPAVEAVVRRCLEKNPDRRYQNYSDLGGDLDAIATGRPPAMAGPMAGPSAEPAPVRGWIAAIAGALVISFLLASIYQAPRDRVQASLPPTPSVSPSSLVLLHPRDPSPSPEPTPVSAPVFSPEPAPDPLDEIRRRIAALLEAGKAIEALALAVNHPDVERPEEEARLEANKALWRGEGVPAVQLGRLLKDGRLEAEGAACIAFQADDYETIFAKYEASAAAFGAWPKVLAEVRAKEWRELPLTGRERWSEESPAGKRIDFSFEGGRLALTDLEAISWMSKEVAGAERGLRLDVIVEEAAKDGWFGLYLSKPAGPAEGQAWGRTLFLNGPRGNVFSVVRTDATTRRELSAGGGGNPPGPYRVELFRRGERVFLAVDGLLLWQGVPPPGEGPAADVRFGVNRAGVSIPSIAVLR